MYAGGRVDHFYDITRLKKTEAQLLDAMCSAERSRERTRRFLSTVSHEVRTAAAGIIGFAELLLEKDLDEESHHFAELIETNGRSLLSLLSNVLDLARIETGMSSTEDQPFSPEKCARQALDAVRSLALQKSLHLELQVTDAVPETVLGDPVRLRQVLTNLLSNAVKFTDEGRVTVRIDADGRKKEDEAEAREFDLLVSVCDTGIGIPAEEQGHLFEAFVQAGSDSDRQFSGSGLGLYIVGRLLDVMNGRIALDSAPGAGTRFHLRIPVRHPA
jgi:signal transduction histidine kinase